MLKFLQKRWFLVSLLVLISAGLVTGTTLSEDHVKEFSSLIKPGWITAVVLFLMSFSLDSRQLKASFRSPGPVLWASLVNFGMIPMMAWLLMPLQLTADFAFGLMIAGSVPCTMAAASVWTRKAGGNDAVSLLVTVLTNGLCFLLTPFWLNWTRIFCSPALAGTKKFIHRMLG
ncbi:MAG: bile acid:sodium symporter [Planctomycetes bacterium]|nr:bile acid:sodium symporter [Planctomycetota bacterium]